MRCAEHPAEETLPISDKPQERQEVIFGLEIGDAFFEHAAKFFPKLVIFFRLVTALELDVLGDFRRLILQLDRASDGSRQGNSRRNRCEPKVFQSSVAPCLTNSGH